MIPDEYQCSYIQEEKDNFRRIIYDEKIHLLRIAADDFTQPELYSRLFMCEKSQEMKQKFWKMFRLLLANNATQHFEK